MQRTNILNLNIRQSKLYGLAKNAVLLFLFLFFSMFGKSFVQSGSLFKEVFSRVAAEDLVCVSQFAINELGRLYFAVKTAVAALTMCMSFGVSQKSRLEREICQKVRCRVGLRNGDFLRPCLFLLP